MAVAYQPEVDTQHAREVETLFVEHHERVLRAAYRITGSMADAEDVAQAVFLRLLHGSHGRIENPASYLYRAAIHGALDLLRRRQADLSIPLDAASEAANANYGGSADQAVAVAEIRARLRQALTCVSPRGAEMFVLRYLEDHTNREIAQLMNTSQAVVAVVLHQVRAKVKNYLQAFQRGKL